MNISTAELALRLGAGERQALARALSLAERKPGLAAELAAHLAHRIGQAQVIGITGPPGAGKSTLVGSLARRFLEMGKSVAVLAVDPSSPVSGGALLGDRFRMGDSASDERCFIRSTATRGALGGLTSAASQMVGLMDAAGFDLVLVETVGTGQSEVAVADLADLTLVVFPPGLGDELQAIKAGILELADLVVVTKGDTEGARLARQALQAAAPLWHHAPPIHTVSALTGDGIDALANAVLSHPCSRPRPARRTSYTPPQEPRSLIPAFASLSIRVTEHLSLDAQLGLSIRLAQTQALADAAALEVICSLDAGDDGFQLGSIAGAFAVLAAQDGLRCAVHHLDLATRSMRLQLERVAPAVE